MYQIQDDDKKMYLLVFLVAIVGFIVIWFLCKLISILKEKSKLQEQRQPNANDIEANPGQQTRTDASNNDAVSENDSNRWSASKQSKESKDFGLAHTSQKSTLIGYNNMSEDSLKSKKSTGFTPTLKSVFPVTTSGKCGSQNFLMLLDSLDALDDEEIVRRDPPATVASSTGIEANPSDETASQTLIGKELENDQDPGRIKLNLIKSEDPKL